MSSIYYYTWYDSQLTCAQPPQDPRLSFPAPLRVRPRSTIQPSAYFMWLGKFSIRLVPNLTIKSVTDYVVKYVQDEFKKLGSKNTLDVYLTHGGEPWIVSHSAILSTAN